MSSQSPTSLDPGSILSNRYHIIRELGRGGFGRTYLAQDNHRFQEKCLLKEFIPLVQSEAELRKAEDLFQREAGILYKLKHDQIPQFQAILRAPVDKRESLFLVQEYIVGENYWDLLQSQRKFDEAQIRQLLLDLLPVLDYIHGLNLIHRDISPDNLILRQSDGKPVLIDFGCVKVAANALSQVAGKNIGTTIGKPGYAPEEQMRLGKAFPSSDLYALAVTCLVLLTAKNPQDLYDSYHGVWHWRKEVNISPYLANIIEKMLAHRLEDRYQSAKDVLQALHANYNSVNNKTVSQIPTLVVAPANPQGKTTTTNIALPNISSVMTSIGVNVSKVTKTVIANTKRKVKNNKAVKNPKKFLHLRRVASIGLGIMIPCFLLGYFVFKVFVLKENNPQVQTSLTSEEQELQKKIYSRLQALKINQGIFYQQVDRIFYERYPELKNDRLSDRPEHKSYRQKWYQIAEELLAQKEKEQPI